MTFVEARLSLQLIAEEEIGAPLEGQLLARKAREDAAWEAAKRGRG